MAIDLKSLSPTQLQALIANAESHMQEARATQVQEVRKKIDALLSGSGLTLDDIYPSRGTGRGARAKAVGKRAMVAPKYRNPENPEETWSGRGRQPLWLVQALKRRGTSIEQFLIEGAQVSAKAAAGKPVANKRGRPAKKATRKRVKR
ncbi:H-NS histone family protein [Dyella sp.]|uniref:H-NS histone family protein n=1 Tax=Dyella sp. TaxID=1869338 RepID=UPI002ECFB5BA